MSSSNENMVTSSESTSSESTSSASTSNEAFQVDQTGLNNTLDYKHVLALSSVKKFNNAVISEQAKQIPLGQKRKRGAPSKAKQALIRQ